MPDLKHVSRYVAGACAEYFAHSPVSDPAAFTARVTEVVFRYLRGERELDGRCSDFECVIAHDAAQVFGWPTRERARRTMTP